MTTISLGRRISSEDPFYQLFQKSIDLIWNAEKLINKFGFEKDQQTWSQMSLAEKQEVLRLVSFFMDGEQEVADDSRYILHQVLSPYYDNNLEKQMFVTVFAMEEAKHTQFFAAYMTNVMSDVCPDLGKDARRGYRLPHNCEGYHRLFDYQNQTARLAADPLASPKELAAAATVYHGMVEGCLARGGYYAKNKVMRKRQLPLLNVAFSFISTDEGRHVTFGINLLKELLAKEKSGDPRYKGVDEAIWEAALTSLPYIVEIAYNTIPDTGDPLSVDFQATLNRVAELFTGIYQTQLQLASFNGDECQAVVDRAVAEASAKDYQRMEAEHRKMFEALTV